MKKIHLNIPEIRKVNVITNNEELNENEEDLEEEDEKENEKENKNDNIKNDKNRMNRNKNNNNEKMELIKLMFERVNNNRFNSSFMPLKKYNKFDQNYK